MQAERPETPTLTRDEVARIRACHVVHAWISAQAYAALEMHAGCRGEHVDRLVSVLVERIALHPGAVEAIIPTNGRPR